MDLIPLTDNILINPDKIDSVEQITNSEGTSLIVYVNGRQYTITDTKSANELITKLRQPDLTKQFWAGR